MFLYLTMRGRTTGNPHKIEIWFAEHDGCYYLCAEKRENADWVQNIQHNGEVRFYLAPDAATVPDEAHDGQARVVSDETEIALVQAVRTKFDTKYNWSDGLLVEICHA